MLQTLFLPEQQVVSGDPAAMSQLRCCRDSSLPLRLLSAPPSPLALPGHVVQVGRAHPSPSCLGCWWMTQPGQLQPGRPPRLTLFLEQPGSGELRSARAADVKRGRPFGPGSSRA